MLPNDSEKIPQDQYARIDMALAELDAALLAKDPKMPQHLRTVHSILQGYPEATHLLTDIEVARVIAGLSEMGKTVIVDKAAAKKAPARGKVSISDL